MTADRQPRPRWYYPAGLAVVVAASAVGFLTASLVGTQPQDFGQPSASASAPSSASASPSATPTHSAEATATEGASTTSPGPTPVVAAPEDVLPPGSAVRVLVLSLRLRQTPSTGAGIVATIPQGELLVLGASHGFAAWGPINADGFDWYPAYPLDVTELPPLPADPPEAAGPIGWIAAGLGSDSYVELVDPRCPSGEVELALVAGMLPWEWLACFGSRSLTLEGTFGCGACGGLLAGTFAPSWLAYPPEFGFLSVEPNQRLGPMALHFPPGGPAEPEPASIIRVIGHFNDTAAAGCVVAPGEPPAAVNASTAELYCRERFVVEGLEVVGTDPDFPSS